MWKASCTCLARLNEQCTATSEHCGTWSCGRYGIMQWLSLLGVPNWSPRNFQLSHIRICSVLSFLWFQSLCKFSAVPREWFWLITMVQRRPGKWAATCEVREWGSYSKSVVGEDTAATTTISKAKIAFSSGYIHLAEALARTPTERMDQTDYCYNSNTGCSP